VRSRVDVVFDPPPLRSLPPLTRWRMVGEWWQTDSVRRQAMVD
jgi:hypothetical protein